MLIIDDSKQLELVLTGAVVNQLPITATWNDTNQSDSSGSANYQTNGFTPVVIVQEPAQNIKRRISYLTLYNSESGPISFTLQVREAMNSVARVRRIIAFTIDPNCTFVFDDGKMYVKKEDGARVSA